MRSLLLIVLGIPILLYFGIGSAFLEGAVERGDSSVSRMGVLFMLLFAMGGITMISFGVVGLMRRKTAQQ
jgi:hypothetical protein